MTVSEGVQPDVVAERDHPADPVPVLELREVRVRFGGIAALDGVELGVAQGELCGLIGPNGAGKSTLFDVISGVRTPNSGRVLLDGREVTRWSAVKRARHGLRRTFQRTQTYGWLSVEDNLLAALEWRGGGGGLPADLVRLPTRRRHETARRERVQAVLEQCGLEPLRGQLAASLPIGAARMVELARALVAEPRLLLLDEPTSGLDDTESARLADSVRSLLATGRSAVLLVEHDMRFVTDVCERVVVLDRGRVLASGPLETIRTNAVVREAYLG